MKTKLCMMMALVLLAASGCASRSSSETADSPFTIDIMSTGKSDCILIRMDDTVILNDVAEEDDFEAICALLDQKQINKIDYLILSHYDRDHIGSAAALIRNYDIGRIIGPDYPEDSALTIALSDAAFSRGLVRERLKETLVLYTENGSLTLDPPDRDYGDDNNNTLIVSIEYRDTSVLLMGDAKKKRIQEHLSVTEQHYDLIKLPHHGDSSRPLERLIEQTEPLWAVATVEDASTIDAVLKNVLEDTGTKLLCTCDGECSFEWRSDTGLTAIAFAGK